MTNQNPKTLVFSFDGTGNEPIDVGKFEEDESISNVMKLHVLMGGGLHEDKSETVTPGGHRQIMHYYNGIGTRENGISIPLLGRLRKIINMAIAPKFGDAARILREAKDDFNNSGYEKGDKVVVFGFSRGAALARKFASEILKKDEQYKVSFLGVFDTVAAMNGIHRKGDRISSDVVFENGTLNKGIERAVHILSLDEDRVPFMPTMINKDHNNSKRILEVWFPGVHSDIGGGYWFDGLSDVTLEFMIKKCEEALTNRIHIVAGNDIESISQLFEKQKSKLSGLKVDDIAIHPMVNGVMHVHSGVLAKMGDQEAREVHVCDNDRISKQHLPILHHSVKKRFTKVPDYRPSALRGLKFKILLEDGSISNPIIGVSGLR